MLHLIENVFPERVCCLREPESATGGRRFQVRVFPGKLRYFYQVTVFLQYNRAFHTYSEKSRVFTKNLKTQETWL